MSHMYISDLHFGHRNCIWHDHRPFADVEQMDQALIHLWNGRVQKDDDVWIVGDFCYRSDKDPVYYLRKLKGRKYLVVGNHGSYHIYGHIHGNKNEAYEFMRTKERALNAGCMINNYTPVSLRELIENNRRFQGKE